MAPPRFLWNASAGRYIDSRGRFVPRRDVLASLEAALRAAKERMRSLSTRLVSGEVALSQWQQGMRVAIKDVHLYSAAAAAGGWAQMKAEDFGKLGPEIRFHYDRLQLFARAIQLGNRLDGEFFQRVELYVLAGRVSYWKQNDVTQRAVGRTEERNVLHPADHCKGGGSCVQESAREWVPIGSLIPIGERLCRARCRCTKEYR